VNFKPADDFNNNNTFYTDSNGLEMQKRIWNERPSFTYSTNATLTSNYYPVTSAIALVDEE